jgi:hypothetical protein
MVSMGRNGMELTALEHRVCERESKFVVERS